MFTAASGSADARASAVKIGPLQADTAVKSYGRLAVWSDRDPGSPTWHIVLYDGARLSIPSTPSAKAAIEVSIGPGPSGAPMLAYVDCAQGCEVVVSDLNGGNAHIVPGSTGASHPAIWGDRVVWVSHRNRVITSLLDGTARKAIAGAPRRECYYTGVYSETTKPRLRCSAPQEPLVEALALHGRQLAMIDTFRIPDGIGASGTTTEVRSESVDGGPQHVVAVLTVGEGDESWVGPSWLGGNLYFYEDAIDAGPLRAVWGFDPAHDTYVRAAAFGYLTGFSMSDARHAYEATAPGDPRLESMCGMDETAPCEVRAAGPFAFKRSRSPAFIP